MACHVWDLRFKPLRVQGSVCAQCRLSWIELKERITLLPEHLSSRIGSNEDITLHEKKKLQRYLKMHWNLYNSSIISIDSNSGSFPCKFEHKYTDSDDKMPDINSITELFHKTVNHLLSGSQAQWLMLAHLRVGQARKQRQYPFMYPWSISNISSSLHSLYPSQFSFPCLSISAIPDQTFSWRVAVTSTVFPSSIYGMPLPTEVRISFNCNRPKTKV